MLELGSVELPFSLSRITKVLLEPQDPIQDTRGDLGAQMCWISAGSRKNIVVIVDPHQGGMGAAKGMATATKSC